METFGSFETDQELASGAGTVVHTASRIGESGPAQYAIKLYLAQAADSPDASRITVQEQAAASSSLIAPVLERGADERGAWFVTRLYPQTLQRIIEGHVALRPEAILHGLLALVRGARALQEAAGRSHGSLNASNILIRGATKFTQAEVVLTDPAPGGAADAEAFERADLRALGLIIFQLVRRRALSDSADWLIVPTEVSAEWKDQFGRDAAAWLALCNQLLAHDVPLATCNLEKLEADLLRLQPKPPVSRRSLALAAGFVALAALGTVLALRVSNRTVLRLTSDPPGASLSVNGRPWGQAGSANRPASLKLKPGPCSLKATFPDLDEVETNLTLRAGQTNLLFTFSYGSVSITSAPAGATVTLPGGRSARTPVTLSPVRPGPVRYVLELEGHEGTDLTGTVRRAESLALLGSLRQITPGTVPVEFGGWPLGATVRDERGAVVVQTGGPRKYLPTNAYMLTATYSNWYGTWPQQLTTNLTVKSGETPKVFFRFAGARVRFVVEPREALLWLTNRQYGRTPAYEFFPAGPITFRFEAPGYTTNFVQASIVAGQECEVRAELKPLGGWVALTSDPSPATIVVQTNGPTRGWATNQTPFRSLLRQGSYSISAQHPGLAPLPPWEVEVKNGSNYTRHFAFDYGVVSLTSDPTNAQFFLLPSQGTEDLIRSPGAVILPSGANRLLARFSRPPLPDATTNLSVVARTTNTHTIHFNYGTVILTSAPRTGVGVLRDGKEVGTTGTNYVDPIVPFGTNLYELVWTEKGKRRPIAVTVTARTRYTSGANFLILPPYTNGLRMRFLHVPDLDVFVGQFEITRRQYLTVMGEGAKTDLWEPDTDGNMPARGKLTWQAAVDFCARLTQQDKDSIAGQLPPGQTWVYDLPTEAQWKTFAPTNAIGNAEAVLRFYDTRINAPLSVEPNPRVPNPFGLCDTFGNVAEWCREQSALGGSYNDTLLTRLPDRFRLKNQTMIKEGSPLVGLRCVLRPN